jgi:hypothetical protein
MNKRVWREEMSIEAMRQALDALERHKPKISEGSLPVLTHDAAITALRAAIEHYDQTALELCEECGWRAVIPGDGCLVCARQKAKPVAFVDQRIHGWPDCFVMEPDPPHTVPLYTAPQEWVGLTDEEYTELWGKKPDLLNFFRKIEAKLKEKNT